MVKGGGFIDLWIRLYERAFLPHMFRLADEVVVVSPSVKVPNREDAITITPAVDVEKFWFAEPTNGTPLRLLFVGRLDGVTGLKGEDILFKAIALAAHSVPDITLEIVGDGNARTAWEAAVKGYGLSDRVIFSGTLVDGDLVAAYHRASVVVLPSITEAESFGMCLIEAMACGRPVIGSRVGGIPFVISHEKDGLLAPPGDPEALAAAIIELGHDSKMRRDMGLRGREKVEDRYSIVTLQRTYEKLFETVLA
jgi:glycosyltransferase involved in cell wall biosynthesis